MSKINWDKELECDLGPVEVVTDQPYHQKTVSTGDDSRRLTYVVTASGQPTINALGAANIYHVRNVQTNHHLAIEVCTDILDKTLLRSWNIGETSELIALALNQKGLLTED